MTVNKRSKQSRMRASRTHGWGYSKHKGSGRKGGVGMAGTGKRAQSKKPSIWKEVYFGKHGFKKKGIFREVNPINLNELEKKADALVAEKKIEKQGSLYIIDIQKLGYNKVLGCGKLTKKLKIVSPTFSKEAVEKIKAAGGEAVNTDIAKPKKIESPKK